MHANRHAAPRPAAFLAAVSVGLAACGGSLETNYADSALDSVESAQLQSALTVPATESAAVGLTASEIATNAAQRAGMYYQPPSCVIAEAAGAQVTYKLTNCTGPFGLVRVTGKVVVIFTISGQQLTAAATATGLKVNGAIVDVDTTAVYQPGASRTLAITTASRGTGIRGNEFTHSGAYTFSWDATCATLSGSWATQSGGGEWTTAVADWKRCSGMCPQAGGTIVYTAKASALSVAGTVVTVTTDGDNTANWTSSRGRSGTVLVNCGQ